MDQKRLNKVIQETEKYYSSPEGKKKLEENNKKIQEIKRQLKKDITLDPQILKTVMDI